MRHRVIWILLALWAGAVALSVLQLLQPPTGDGFTRGLNRVNGFFQFQAVAVLIGLGVLVLRRRAEGHWLRRVMLVPVGAALLLFLGIAGMLIFAFWGPV